MLTFHELWQDYSVTDWMALFRENVTRPTPQAFDPSGVWSDCVFFSAWLQLNPFPLLLEINAQLGGSAFLVARHFRINAPLLFPDKSDWEALDGKTFCDIALLEAARKKLLAQDSRLVRPYTNAEELKEYLTSLHDSGVFGPAP
jgi:hypothetical protein